MAAVAGTKVGSGFVEIHPDFSRFQEKVGKQLNQALAPAMQRAGGRAGKDLARGIDRGGFGQMLRQRFGRIGDDAGKELAAKVSKGAKRAEGDMFGLADAVRQVERNQRKASRASKALGGDMFGIGRAAKEAGRGLAFSSSHTNSWTRRADGATASSKRLGDRIKGLGYEFGSLSRGIRTSSGGFSGFDGVMARVNRSTQFFRNILRAIKWPVFIAGIGLSLQGLSALAAGAVAAASALGSLSGVLVALPAAALAGAQAFGAFKLATSGVADAVKAALDVETSGGQQAVDVLRQQRDAAERVADAKRNLIDVQAQAEKAQDDLREARESATRQLQDMRLAAEASGTSEKQAALSLREARRELARTLADPAASGLDVQGAELAVEQARNDLQGTRVEAKRAREDYKDAQKKGVEGMPEVVAAKEAEADANRAVTDAQRDLRRATEDATAAMESQGSAASALQEKMAGLPPAGQKFARFLISLKPRLDSLRATAAKGLLPGAEKGIKGALRNFGVFRGLIDGTSKSLGRLAAKAGDRLGTAAWGKDLSRLGKLNTRIIDRMGGAGLNLADALRHVLIAAEPFLDWLSESTLGLSEWVKGEAAAGRETGRLGAFFDRTRETMERLGRILKGVGGGLLNVSEAGRSLGNEILDSLGDAAEGWRKWTDSTKGQNRLKRYFEETKPAVWEMGRLIRDVGKTFFELGRQRGVAHLLRMVRTGLLPALRELVGATTGWVSGFLKDFQSLRRQGTAGFDAFVQVLAEHAAEAGVKIAKALVHAFINADIWGKLAIGGFLFSKFGGVSAFDKFGKNAGRRFAAGFLLAVLSTELAKEIKTIIEGHKLDAPKSEKFAATLNEAFDADNAAKIIAPNRVKITTALGTLIFNPATEKVIKAQGKRLQQFVGEIPAQILPEFNKLRVLPQKLKSTFQPLPGIAGKTGVDLRRAFLPKLDELSTRGGKKAETFAERIGNAFKGMTGTATEAMEILGTNVSQMLRMLGGKPPKFNLDKALQSLPELKPLPGEQRGGQIRPAQLKSGGLAATVPGTSTGDRHVLSLNGRPVAKVESKEGIFVGNRNLMGALHQANAEVPRFQKGGQLGVEPQIAGPAGSLRSIGQLAIKKVYEGAKDFMDNHKPAGGGLMSGSGPVEKVFADVARKLSTSKIASLALGMAGFAESGMRDLHYGDSSSEGALQLLASTASGLGIDPHDEAAVASHFLLKGYWGKGGANSLARQGLPAHLVAQSVQGSAFYDGSNYLAQEGPAKQWMRRFGLREGGLLKRAGGGAVTAPKDGNPFNPLAMRGGPASAPSLLAGESGFLPKTIGRIKAKAAQIANAFTGYVWGGGHGEGTNVLANGLDCSGAIAKLVQQSGWPDFAVAHSSEYARRFHSGVGDLFTLWSNNDHTFAEIEGRMWGTNTSNGLGYHSHTTAGFSPSHPILAPEGAGGSTGTAAAPKEKVPASYQGAKTGNLDFGPKPKTAKEAEKQITKWQKEVGVYRKAKRHAEKHGKPDTAQAIGQNLTKIEERLSALRSLRTQLRVKEVREKLNKRISKAFGRFGNYEQIIEGSQLDYEEAAQDAEQLVELEPRPPELPANATDKQREEAEKAYVAQFTNYVESRERPAYQGVLELAANWRNNILRAETFGFGKGNPSVSASQGGWEGETRGVRARIEKIQRFSEQVDERVKKFKDEHKGEPLPDGLKKQVAERDAMRKELPVLRLRDTRLSDAVLKARELFFPGGEHRLKELPMGKRVQLPLPGSGSFEEKLREVQGLHWPEQHELLSAGEIGGKRQDGRFGGVIWSVQETIEGLGLKISDAINGAGSGEGGSEDDDSELVSLLREIAERERKGRLTSERLANTAAQFNATYGDLPKFHSGGVTPGPANREFPALLKGHETVRTAEQEMGLISAIQGIAGGGAVGLPIVETHIHGDIISDHPDPVETVIRDPRTKRVIQRTRGDRPTAGGARR